MTTQTIRFSRIMALRNQPPFGADCRHVLISVMFWFLFVSVFLPPFVLAEMNDFEVAEILGCVRL
ncbi:hypothetical protein [Desulfonema ishimotonii]|uniref:hypothetical protein n=1 Tax=Desulfonema ishimotonii TaxID=45657 RepID=UPI000F58A534|nr:hypothetical protein [Desulfonema ishimotonii]